MKMYVDIDETICKTPENRDYSKSVPINRNIKKINEMYDKGHTIVYWSARGRRSGLDHTELTIDQLDKWGAKYHDVQVGNKPHFDMYICDKSYNSESFFHYQERGLP